MKVTDFLVGMGRPVAYYPGLRKITKSTTATIFLCQFIYWVGKGSMEGGWIYKTSDEIEEETGLTYNEQVTARKNLVSLGFLEEKYARLDHQMLFKINLAKIDNSWEAYAQCQIPESHNAELGNWINPSSLKGTTENTTETTTDINPEPYYSEQPHPFNGEEPLTQEPINSKEVVNSRVKLNKPEPEYEPINLEQDLPQSFVDEYKPIYGIKVDPKIDKLAREFVKLSGIKYPLYKSKKDYGNYSLSWWKPLERMLYEVDDDVDRACDLLGKAMVSLKALKYSVTNPRSVEKSFVRAKIENQKPKQYATDPYGNVVEI